MTMIRGEMGDLFLRRADGVGGDLPMQTVTVEIDVLPVVAKEALDLLLDTAYEFSTRPEKPPF